MPDSIRGFYFQRFRSTQVVNVTSNVRKKRIGPMSDILPAQEKKRMDILGQQFCNACPNISYIYVY